MNLFNIHSVFVVLLISSGALIVIVLLSRIRLAKMIAAEKERIGVELAVAKRIQSSLLPCKFPPFPDRREFDLYAIMNPAEEVGGDFYDFFFVNRDTLCLVIADVSGESVPAALFMIITKILIQTNAQTGMRPAGVFKTVNNLLCEQNEAEMFVTAFMGYLDIPSGRFTFVNAGHNPPLIRQGGSFRQLKVHPGFVLAGLRGFSYTESEVMLRKGDALCLYTDGVTEAMNPSKDLFSVKRLLSIANGGYDGDLYAFTSGIRAAVASFAANEKQADDITLLTFRYDGEKSQDLRTFEVMAEVDNLRCVQRHIADLLNEKGCSEPFIRQIETVAEEAFVNIAHYAYAPARGEVTISLCVEDDIVLVFSDTGIPFDPTGADDLYINMPAEERAPGGLGILITKKIMDKVSYRYEDGHNILTLTKKMPVPGRQ
jgi:sigma-B regulation protein RsbU (phosphoserine phosphatase)